MRAVRDTRDGLAVFVEHADGEAHVRDPATGKARTVPTARLAPLDGAVPAEARGGHSDRELGLLLSLAGGPRRVRWLLDALGLCESDLHGTVGQLRVAGLVAPTTVDGSPGYRATGAGRDRLAALRAALADAA